MKIKVGIDLGASAIKIVFLDAAGKLVKTTFLNRIGDDTVEVADGYKVVRNVNGKDTVVFVGHEEGITNITAKKVNLKYLEEIILTVAYIIKQNYKSSDKEIQMEVAALLPVDQYKESKEVFKSKLKELSVQGIVQEDIVIATVIDAVIRPEGLTLLNSINIADYITANNLLLLDVGASTSDWMLLRKKEGGYMPVRGDSVPAAGTEMMRLITTAINQSHNGESTFTWQELERDMSFEWMGDVHSVYSYANSAENVAKKIINALNIITNLNQLTVVVAGRAGKLLTDTKYFKDNVPTYHLLNKDVSTFGNAEGALKSI